MRTVHRLEHVLLIFLWRVNGLERILAIVGIVARGNIEVLRTDMRSDNLLIAKALLNLAQVILQAQAKLCSLRQPDGQALAYFVGEHEQLHLLANLTVVAFLGFLEHHKILVEHLLLGEGDAVQTLHLLTGSIAAPEGTGHACQFHSLYLACIHQVRATAKIGERTLCIGRDGSVLQVLLNMLALVGLAIGSKLLQRVGLGHFFPNNGLFLRGQFLHLLFNLREVAFLYALPIGQQHVIKETTLYSRTEAELNARIKLLQGLSQQVSTCMPEGVLALFVIPLVKFDFCVLRDRAVQLHGLTVHSASQNAACQSR